MIDWAGPPISKQNEAILEARWQAEKKRSEEIWRDRIIKEFGSLEAYREHVQEKEDKEIIRKYGSHEAHEEFWSQF